MNILCIIPARAGSKRVKNKNIKKLNGIPLVQYSIKSALESKKITHICLSTNSNKIKNLGQKLGLDVPFLRNERLSNSASLTVNVVKDSIKRFEKIYGISYDKIILLQPTCPFRELGIIDKSISILSKNKSLDSLVSICDVGGNHPFRMKYLNKKNIIKNVIDQGFEDMRPIQKLKKVYLRSGSIYLCKKEVIFKYNSLVGKNTYGLEMKGKYQINIDTPEDFNLAKKYIKL